MDNPASPTEIIDEIEALCAHCRPPIMSVEQRARWQQDWARDLAKYPLNAIQSAFRQWRQGESLKFPTPGQILPAIDRAAGMQGRAEMDVRAWRYEITDDEYRSLSLRDKIRHHRIAASHCRMKAGPMWRDGRHMAIEDMPAIWHDWRRRAENHDAEAKRLSESIGAMEERA